VDTCDVLVVGGGPAGSSCAWKLREAGLDVVVLDRATFPRDKVCAGWITPQVISDLCIDTGEYRRGRTFQPITGFRTGLIGGSREVETLYDRPISFGIRRCEFDSYLLRRAGARLYLGSAISSIRRENGGWIVNDSLRAAMLVGAGGHFCPVARWLNPRIDDAPVVVAQEVEFPIEEDDASWTCAPELPELYFCRDLKGYGWCFRKQRYLNVGLGRLDRRSLPRATAAFVRFLEARRKVPSGVPWRWSGHAYLLSGRPRRRIVDTGVLLVGDAAGLAYPQSGEGIRPAIEAGLLAASAIVDAKGHYTRDRLKSYESVALERFGDRPARWVSSGWAATMLSAAVFPLLLNARWFVRHLVLDRWFLHAHEPALAIR
jgi:geranylgeranyl reductase family protein